MKGARNHDDLRLLAGTVLLAALPFLGVAEARADEPPGKPQVEAPTPSTKQLQAGKQFFARGQKLFRDGKYGAAWLEFSSAYEITGSPELVLNMALCKVKMNRPKEAIDHYRDFLRQRPDDPEAANINAEITRLEQELNGSAGAKSSDDGSKKRFPVIGTVLAGSSLLFIVFGGVAIGVGQSRFNDLSQTCKPACTDDQVSNARTPFNAGYAMFGLAAATAVAAAIVLPLELGAFGGAKKKDAKTALLLGPSSLSIVGRF